MTRLEKLSVVMPAFNEQETLEQVILEHVNVLQSMNSQLSDWEIVCLDDASTDQTSHILNRLTNSNSRVRMIRHELNRGIYESFTHLFHEARGSHIYVTAADGQWPTENMRGLLEALKEGNYDLVIGVRQNRAQVYSFWRRVLSYGFNLLPQIFFGVKTMDANGIKLGRRELFTMPLGSKSFFAEIERIVEAKKKGFRVGFAPIQFCPRGGGKATGAKWNNIWATAVDFIKYLSKK